MRRAGKDKMIELGEMGDMTMVSVRPYSIVFVRGDAVHCGRGAKDMSILNCNEERSLRCHLHFVPQI